MSDAPTDPRILLADYMRVNAPTPEQERLHIEIINWLKRITHLEQENERLEQRLKDAHDFGSAAANDANEIRRKWAALKRQLAEARELLESVPLIQPGSWLWIAQRNEWLAANPEEG